MDEIAVSKFKATCLAALERVRRTGRPLRVTRFGRPLADVVPATTAADEGTWLGAMAGRGQIAGRLTLAPVDLIAHHRHLQIGEGGSDGGVGVLQRGGELAVECAAQVSVGRRPARRAGRDDQAAAVDQRQQCRTQFQTAHQQKPISHDFISSS